MKIACFSVGMPHPRCLEAIELYAPSAVFVDTGADVWDYWRKLSALWGQDDLMTIEQDIAVAPDAVESFENCPELWCVYEYKAAGLMGPPLRESLGCTRFRKELMQVVTAAEIGSGTYTQMPGMKIPSAPTIAWDRIDWRMSSHLKHNGFKSHIHGEVKHYHPYPNKAANELVANSVDIYLEACRDCLPDSARDQAFEQVAVALEFANSGEMNASPVLLPQSKG